MPEEPVWFPRDEILSYEEIFRLVRICAAGGVRKVRITGGEPLLRRDLPRLIAMLAQVPQIDDLSLTTNGLLLGEAAAGLTRAGLRRVNVSLDTILPERFRQVTRRPLLQKVLDGLAGATAAGLTPVKVNTVVVRGVNEDEIETFTSRAREEGWEIRFIEFMPLENGETWSRDRVVTGEEIRRRIHDVWPLEREPSGDQRAPARRYRFRDGKGSVGFINSVSEPFCSTCSRLRITADGRLRVCLYDGNEIDLKTALRTGATDDELERAIRRALEAKDRGGALKILEREEVLPLSRTMHQIGG
jgi:cyclic pyranopterin phosphate synthase